MTMSASHVRPKVIKSNGSTKAKAEDSLASSSSTTTTKELEQKMQSWMGLQSSPLPKKEEGIKKKPISILKTPKYSSSTTSSSIEQQPDETLQEKTFKQSASVVCEEFIVERDPYRPIQKKKLTTKNETITSHLAVEGYETNTVPKQKEEEESTEQTTSKNTNTTRKNSSSDHDKDDDDDVLILSSLEEMFEAAGEKLPDDRTTITPDTKLLEADLSFSVMSKEQYGEKFSQIKREMEDDRRDMYKMFLGSNDAFEGESSNGDLESDNDSDDDDDDDEFLEFLMENEDYESDEVEQTEVQPRAFRLVWNALSSWLTPEAVDWMARLEKLDYTSHAPLHNNERALQVDKSDIGASRCAGLMAMIKMYLPSSMKELKHPDDRRRIAELRIGDFLRTFDYSREAPKNLGVKMWKAITCILLDMVLVETREASVERVPPSVETVGMTKDEYRYLTRSAVQAFQSTR